jgi:hypothetical protein
VREREGEREEPLKIATPVALRLWRQTPVRPASRGFEALEIGTDLGLELWVLQFQPIHVLTGLSPVMCPPKRIYTHATNGHKIGKI